MADRRPARAPARRAIERRAEAARKAANRFDIRRIIGGLFLLYGVILTVAGDLRQRTTTKTKAAGININLWTGLGMLVFGALMVYWALTRPVEPPVHATR